MTLSIWKTRNAWIFNEIDPTVGDCCQFLKKTWSLLVAFKKTLLSPS
jgi:hypothetical protein